MRIHKYLNGKIKTDHKSVCKKKPEALVEDLEGCCHWEQGQGAPPQPNDEDDGGVDDDDVGVDDDDDGGVDDDGGDGDGGDKYQVWQGAPPQAGVEILMSNLKFPPQT